MNKILFTIFCVFSTCVSAQDTILFKNISKRYAYEIAVFSQNNSKKAHFDVKNQRVFVYQNDTLKITLKDKVLNQTIPFIGADSSRIVSGHSYIKRNLQVDKSGCIIFYPSLIPIEQNIVYFYVLSPCHYILLNYAEKKVLNKDSEAGTILCNLYENIHAKKPVNWGIFEISVFYEQDIK